MGVRPLLTELEGDVLGFIWKLGPVTTYRLRKIFVDSPSSHWRASAGSIYPAVQRLLERGLVRGSTEKTGARSASMLLPTPRGERALAEWVAPTDPSDIAAFTHDPVRTRLHFLGLLPRAERKRYLARLEALLEEQVALYRTPPGHDPEDEWDAIVRRGALAMHRARLRWIRQVAKST